MTFNTQKSSNEKSDSCSVIYERDVYSLHLQNCREQVYGSVLHYFPPVGAEFRRIVCLFLALSGRKRKWTTWYSAQAMCRAELAELIVPLPYEPSARKLNLHRPFLSVLSKLHGPVLAPLLERPLSGIGVPLTFTDLVSFGAIHICGKSHKDTYRPRRPDRLKGAFMCSS